MARPRSGHELTKAQIRELVRLRRRQKLSFPKIAKRTGVHPSTVMYHVKKAEELLDRLWAETVRAMPEPTDGICTLCGAPMREPSGVCPACDPATWGVSA